MSFRYENWKSSSVIEVALVLKLVKTIATKLKPVFCLIDWMLVKFCGIECIIGDAITSKV